MINNKNLNIKKYKNIIMFSSENIKECKVFNNKGHYDLCIKYNSISAKSGYRTLVLKNINTKDELLDMLYEITQKIENSKCAINYGISADTLYADTFNRYIACKELINILH